MGAIKKRNHYLPKAYLQGFCDSEGLLWIFDRRSKEYRRLPPDSVAVEKEFYIVKDSSGKKTNIIEDCLADCENEAIPIIRRLNADHRILNEQDRRALAKFTAFLRLRTTVFNEEVGEVIQHYATAAINSLFKDKQSAQATLASVTGNEAAIPPEKLESLISMVKAGQFTGKVNREFVIRQMIQRANTFAEELFAMTWILLRSNQRSSFITADLPWSMLSIDPTKPTEFSFRDMFRSYVRTVVPLTASVAVMFEAVQASTSGARHGYLPHRQFNQTVNRTIADNSHRFVFSGSEELLRRLVKTSKIDRVNRPMRLYGGKEDWLTPTADQISGIVVSGF